MEHGINDQTLRILMWVAAVLLSIIGFLLSFYFKRSVDSTDKLNATVNNLNVTLTGVKAQMKANEDMAIQQKESCKERHATINERIGELDDKLIDHEKRLRDLEIVKI